MIPMKRALLTGGAGFIGSHVADRLLSDGWNVTVVDNFDPFYDAEVKWRNVRAHLANSQYRLIQADIRDFASLRQQADGCYDAIVHLAAKAGVRPSIADPAGYQQTNVIGTQNMLELAKTLGVKQFVFASSSSVYGINPEVPWREDNHVLLPISPYASTKVSGELLGHVYSHLFGIRFLALRFFTVYGPRQRPDLAIHKMANMMLNDEVIPIFGDGTSRRDYTYVDDIVNGIGAAIDYDGSMYEVINLGGSHTVELLEMVRAMEGISGVTARLQFHPDQPGDVPQTYADTAKAQALLGFRSSVTFEAGLKRFFEWLNTHAQPGVRATYA